MNGVTSLATISYLDRWSWRTWTLVQSLNTRIAELEREVENLQEDLNKDCGVGEASRESAAGCGRGTCRGEPAVRTWNWFE